MLASISCTSRRRSALLSYPETARLGDELFPAADKALYAAKREGRNCVRFARPLNAEQDADGEGMEEGGEDEDQA